MKFREQDIKMMTSRLSVAEIVKLMSEYNGKRAMCDNKYVSYTPVQNRPTIDIFQFIDDIKEALE